jgi:mono/diheme cytochrome c family protein
MMRSAASAVLGVIGSICATSIALAQAQPQRADIGAMEYRSSCAACHGPNGNGNGPYNAYLTKSPTDLTTLAKKNGGVFPVQQIYAVIDGRASPEVGAHGDRDMPIWGDVYRVRSNEFYLGFPMNPEVYVRARILALVDYINRLQAK